MKPLFLVSLLLISMAVCGQNRHTLDSIESALPEFTGSMRARALFELVYGYVRSDLSKSRKYLDECVALRNQVDDTGKAYTYLAEGMYLNAAGKIDSGMLLLEKAKKYAEATNAHHALLKLYSALSYTYISSGKAEKGLESLYKGLEVIEVFPDQEMEMRLRTNVTWAYLELKQYRNGIDFGLKNIKLMQGSRYEWIALYTFNNMAVCYGALGMLDSARFFVGKGAELAERNKDMQALANSHFILGTIYSNAGEYKLALEQYETGRPIRQKVGNPLFIVSDLYTMADLYHKTGQYKKGVEVASEALKLVEAYDLTLKYENTYLSLARNYEGLKDFANASKYYKLYASAKDTAYTNANATAIAEMQARYETEKNEKLLALQKVEIVEKDAKIQETYFVIVFLVITLITLTLLFSLIRSRMLRRQLILQQEKEVQVREAHIQATIQSQERERKRFAQDLHDGMGQLISALRLTMHSVNKTSSIEERVGVSEKGEKILNAMHDEIRGIAFNLMPQTLVKHGLVPALKEMCERLNSGDIRIQLSSYDLPDRMDEVFEVSLYRVIQEWVNNVIKYSGAKNIQLQLTGYEDECNIVIEDDGRGFNPLNLENSKGNGWRNIKSRLNLIKASIEIDSREGLTGTTTIIKLPVTPAMRASKNHGIATSSEAVEANTH